MNSFGNLWGRFSMMLCLLLTLSSCQRYIDWGTKRFTKADELCTQLKAVQCADVKFAPIRDPFMTYGLPRAMYWSPEVIALHQQLAVECKGMSHEDYETTLEALLEEQEEKTVMYVSIYESKKNWDFTLVKDGVSYPVATIKRVDLDRDYLTIFGESATRYLQNILKLTFDVPASKPFALQLCTKKYKTCMYWD